MEKTLIAEGKAKLVYRHFSFLSDESRWAAEATECAGEQGQFWPYHDKLFEEQSGGRRGVYAKANLKRFAADVKLETESFNACLDSGRYADKVRAETEIGRQKGVRATPTVFVNGQKIEGVPQFEQIRQLVETAIRTKPGR